MNMTQNDRPKKKRKRRSVWDLPPIGDPRDHMCFDPMTVYSTLGLLATSFVFLIYAYNTKVDGLTKERKREIKKQFQQKLKKVSEGKIE